MHPLPNSITPIVWHPFTQMRDWLAREPIVIVEGQGAVLRDVNGREFLDANSSIWTNLHGHQPSQNQLRDPAPVEKNRPQLGARSGERAGRRCSRESWSKRPMKFTIYDLRFTSPRQSGAQIEN